MAALNLFRTYLKIKDLNKLFVPADFIVPLRIETTDFILRKLTTRDVERDFEAVMSSVESLRQIFGPDDTWPSDEMTLQDNFSDLQEHEDHFAQRRGFTYTVLSPAEDLCIGCVYIYHWDHEPYDTQVYYWVRDSVKPAGLEDKLGEFLHRWLDDSWPIEKAIFPGRDVSWEDWEALKQERKEKSD